MPTLELENTTLRSDANLVAYYRLEDETDELGSFDLTNNGTVTFAAAKFNNGADHGSNNTTKYLRVANDLGITNGSMSAVFWYNPSAAPASGDSHYLLVKGDAGTNVIYNLFYNNNAGTLRLRFFRGKSGTADDEFSYNVDLGTGTFKQIAMTYDGTTLRGYVDGAEVGNVLASGDGSTGASDELILGAVPSGTVKPPHGILDDYAVFNRELDDSEILGLFEGTLGFAPKGSPIFFT